MYVIQVTGTNADAPIGKTTSNTVVIPADRCVWEQSYTNDNYAIAAVRVFTGNAANVTALNTSNSYELGYIGKSGRFVAITG